MTISEMNPANKLTRFVEKNQLAEADGQKLIEAFWPLFESAEKLVDQADKIKVVDATHISEMKAAHDLRMKLREVRIAGEKSRKSFKEESVRRGRAIEGIGNLLSSKIEPVEERLLEMEKFAERAEAARKTALVAAREEILRPYGFDTSFYNLADMPQETFDELHGTHRRDFEAKKAAALKAEEDRVAAVKAKADEDARIRAEAIRLKAENDAIAAKAKAERDAIQAKADAQAKADREARQKAQDELAAIQQAEAKKKADEEAARRKAESAGDAEKMAAFVAQIRQIPVPTVSSPDNILLLRDAKERLEAVAVYTEDAVKLYAPLAADVGLFKSGRPSPKHRH